MAIVNRDGLEGRDDFLGFSFNGSHSSEFNIINVNTGDRTGRELLPSPSHTTAQVTGRDGKYYFNATYPERKFSINIAYDDLKEDDFRRIQNWLAYRQEGPLIFDEEPYKQWSGKISSAVKMNFICFDDLDGQRRYKGEGTFEFTCFYPWAVSPFLSIAQMNTDYAAKFRKEHPEYKEKETEEDVYILNSNELDVRLGNTTEIVKNAKIWYNVDEWEYASRISQWYYNRKDWFDKNTGKGEDNYGWKYPAFPAGAATSQAAAYKNPDRRLVGYTQNEHPRVKPSDTQYYYSTDDPYKGDTKGHGRGVSPTTEQSDLESSLAKSWNINRILSKTITIKSEEPYTCKWIPIFNAGNMPTYPKIILSVYPEEVLQARYLDQGIGTATSKVNWKYFTLKYYAVEGKQGLNRDTIEDHELLGRIDIDLSKLVPTGGNDDKDGYPIRNYVIDCEQHLLYRIANLKHSPIITYDMTTDIRNDAIIAGDFFEIPPFEYVEKELGHATNGCSAIAMNRAARGVMGGYLSAPHNTANIENRFADVRVVYDYRYY